MAITTMYHALYYKNFSVVRRADNGISDKEFNKGVRHTGIIDRSKMYVGSCLNKYHILTEDEWQEQLFGKKEIGPDRYTYKSNKTTLFDESTETKRPLY